MDKDFITIKDPDVIGKVTFQEGYYDVNPNDSCLWPGIKIESIGKDRYRLIPGRKTYDGNFYFCPLQLKYIQIDSLESDVSTTNKNFITGTIVLFSKDYTKKYPIELNLNTHNGLQNRVSFYFLKDLINILNLYVFRDGDLNILNEAVFQGGSLNLIPTEESFILYQINKLKFKHFSNDMNRMGKDNSFWNEIEITNLPKNSYLKKLFLQILSKSKKFDSLSYSSENNMIFITYGREYAYCKADGRRELKPSSYLDQEVLDILKINLYKF